MSWSDKCYSVQTAASPKAMSLQVTLMECYWPQLSAGIYVPCQTRHSSIQILHETISTNGRQLCRASGGKQTKYKCCQIICIYFGYSQNQCALKTNCQHFAAWQSQHQLHSLQHISTGVSTPSEDFFFLRVFITYPYIQETSMTTSIMSQHNSYDCMSTGELSVAM